MNPWATDYELSGLPLCCRCTTKYRFKHFLIFPFSQFRGRIWTLGRSIETSGLTLCPKSTIKQWTICCHFLSLSASSRMWTPELRIMSQVVYHCVADVQPSTGLNTFWYVNSPSFVVGFEPLVVVLSQVDYHCAPRAQQSRGQSLCQIMSWVVYHCATGAQLGTGLNTFCYFHSPSSSDRILTLDLSIESSGPSLCPKSTTKQGTICCHFLSLSASSRMWTPELQIMSQVVYLCATGAQPKL